MKAIFEKETEKAVCMSYMVDIYGEFFAVKNMWFPKSQIEIITIDGNTIEFNPKNNWILDAKTKDYCKRVASQFNVKTEIKIYLSRMNNLAVTECWA